VLEETEERSSQVTWPFQPACCRPTLLSGYAFSSWIDARYCHYKPPQDPVVKCLIEPDPVAPAPCGAMVLDGENACPGIRHPINWSVHCDPALIGILLIVGAHMPGAFLSISADQDSPKTPVETPFT